MSAYLIKEIDTQKRITVRTGSRVVDGGGEGYLEWIDLADADGTVERTPADGLFLLLGADPGCAWLPDEVARDERGFVLTGREIPRDRWRDGLPPAPLETTVPGIFAAGDVRAGSMKRVASASGEGAAAVAQVHAHLDATTPADQECPRLIELVEITPQVSTSSTARGSTLGHLNQRAKLSGRGGW